MAFTVTEFRPSTCPKNCLCGVGTSLSPLSIKGYFATVSCTNRKLTDFPARLPSETRIVVLRGNALTSTALPGESAMPPRLAELDLSYNVIDYLLTTYDTDMNLGPKTKVKDSRCGKKRKLTMITKFIRTMNPSPLTPKDMSSTTQAFNLFKSQE